MTQHALGVLLIALTLLPSAARAQFGDNARDEYVRGYVSRTDNAGPLTAALDKVKEAKQGLDNAINALNSLGTDGNLLGRWKTKSVCVDVPSCQTPCKAHRYECGAWALPQCSTSCSGPWWKVRCSTSCTTPCSRWDAKECIVWWPESCTWSKRCNDVRYFDPTEGNAFKAAKAEAERLWNAARAEYDRKKAELEASARKTFDEVKKGAEDAIRDTKAGFEKLVALAASSGESVIQTLFEKVVEISGLLLSKVADSPNASRIEGLRPGLFARRNPPAAAMCSSALDPKSMVRNALANAIPIFAKITKEFTKASVLKNALASGDRLAGKTAWNRFQIFRHKQQFRFPQVLAAQTKAVKFQAFAKTAARRAMAVAGVAMQVAALAGAYLWAAGECASLLKNPNVGETLGGPAKGSAKITAAYYDCYADKYLDYTRAGMFDLLIETALVPLNVLLIVPYATGLTAAVTAALATTTSPVGAAAAGVVTGVGVVVALNAMVTFLAGFGFESYTQTTWPTFRPFFEERIIDKLGKRPGGTPQRPAPGKPDPVAPETMNPYVPVTAGQLRLLTHHKTLVWVDAKGKFATSARTDRGGFSLFKVQPEKDGWFRLLTAHNTHVAVDKQGKFHTRPTAERGDASLFRFEGAPKGRVRLITHHRTIAWVTPQGELRTSSYTDRGAFSELRLEDSTAVAKAECKRSGKPVCAAGQTFDSACSARRAGRHTFTRGECAVAVAAAGDGAVYLIRDDGVLQWNIHDGREKGEPRWRSPQNKTVGSGWSSFAHVFASGDRSVYAVKSNGDLTQYKHVGRSDGTPRWEGPRHVGSGWQIFTKVFPGPGDILYGIKSDGTLCWYRHTKRAAMAPGWQYPSCRVVGSGWNMYRIAFAGTDGVLYGIKPDGTLLWQKHLGQRDGTAKWLHPAGRVVGSGWDNFAQVIATGGGYLYTFNPRRREVRWYQHDGRGDGTPRWKGGHTVGTGWSGTRFFGTIAD